MPSTPATTDLQIDVCTPPDRVHPIRIGIGLAQRLGAVVAEACPDASRLYIASSPRVWRLLGPRVLGGLDVPADRIILIPDGERSKTLSTMTRVLDALVGDQADRRAVLVVVGGGVIGDMAGFAAATFLRGIGLVHVPTTVVAQVDSAIGGKVGVNHRLGKNLIGAFHQPRLVAVDPDLLRTLSRRELRAGLYEVVKYAVIASADLFGRLDRDLPALLRGDIEALAPVVEQCCRIKAHVVSSDEREQGLRRILNFGHTIGHALEAVTAYRVLRHGEAVAYGMRAVSAMARDRGQWTGELHAALIGLLDRMGPLPSLTGVSAAECLDAMGRDKKAVAGTLRFVLPVTMGDTEIVADVSTTEIARALQVIGVR
jgi:3-dehydroquinate synthase